MEGGSNGPNLECRMYEPKLPEVDTMVMVMVKNITDLGAYVVLLEYNNMEGMILLSELSKRRIRSVKSLIKVGRIEPVMVIRVEKEEGYIDLSKRRVSQEDIAQCEERYNKSKLVHSIMRHVAESTNVDLEVLYERIAWPLYRKHGHAFDAFKTVVTDPDSVLVGLNSVTAEMKDALVKNVRRRMTPQPLKIRADIEMKCFEFDGVLHIKEAMRKAEAAGTDDCPVKIKLVAAPLYVITIQTLDKDQGFSTVNKAITACTEEIRRSKGMLVVKEAARIVSESDDKLFRDGMEKINRESEDDDDDSDADEEDAGMGDIDAENGGIQS